MNSYIINFKLILASIAFLFATLSGFAQSDASKWKAQFALGVNSPDPEGFVANFEAKTINFPTVNLGLQHMFSKQFGVRLDFGFNRIVHHNDSPYFKVNYTRINAQLIYDATPVLGFLPYWIGVIGHVGPGFSMITPLGEYGDNKTSFLNAMAGIEFHYQISEQLAVFFDTSYIYGFSNSFNPISDGYGSFNGNLLTATIGVSYALGGCAYCD